MTSNVIYTSKRVICIYIDDLFLGILEKWESLVPGIIACFASLAGDKYNIQYSIYQKFY